MDKLKLNKIDKPAFTIIEVVLVLAIAGLIFLMVFIALHTLQRNQRDTQRKNDLNRALTAVRNYQANNKNQVPTGNWRVIFASYLNPDNNSEFKDPDGSDYDFSGTNYTAANGEYIRKRKHDNGQSLIIVYWGASCGEGKLQQKQGNNSIALSMTLDGGGVYCVNN